jgi:hypothetical protein
VIKLFAIVLTASALQLTQNNDLSVKIQQARAHLTPRPLTLRADQYTVAEALEQLAKQTGNQVLDQRKEKANNRVQLSLDRATFWQVLEQLCRQAGCGFSAYGEGGVVLVDAPLGRQSVSQQGIFRTAIKQTHLSRDEQTGLSTCAVVLDVAWEPRFQPFYLSIGAAQATFAPDAKGRALMSQTPARGQVSVAGRGALEVEIHLEAPHRSSPSIGKLAGSFVVLGPSKMLTVTLPELKAGATQMQEEIEVRVATVKESLERWIVEVEIHNPEGTPELESFQSWLHNNRVQLVQGPAQKQVVWRPEPSEAVLLETPRKALLQYAFADPAGKGKPAEWALVVHTPGRIVQITVPYTFKDVQLP